MSGFLGIDAKLVPEKKHRWKIGSHSFSWPRIPLQELIANVRRLLRGEELQPLTPWPLVVELGWMDATPSESWGGGEGGRGACESLFKTARPSGVFGDHPHGRVFAKLPSERFPGACSQAEG